jgi:excisionase family DNA binding protein
LRDRPFAGREGTHTTAEIAELFGVARSTVYRAIERAKTRN